jgi:hypothetical protein
MTNPTFKRWTADEIAKLKNMAQKHPSAEIALQLGRSTAATNVKASQLKLSLRCRRTNAERSSLSSGVTEPPKVHQPG